LSIGANLTSGFTISYQVSKIAITTLISSVSHDTTIIIKNAFMETDSPPKIVQLSLYNHVNPCSSSWDTR
jgi:hypothetical protein